MKWISSPSISVISSYGVEPRLNLAIIYPLPELRTCWTVLRVRLRIIGDGFLVG